ncbi:MAG: metallophosphoesterase family protein [Desulfobacterales bacterium]|nr:metallophosphoesterase family protein [Desulfobacterales bacterium]MBS3755928.1 metallophosphoesterase family protein [Desulfobacterales bacterium]
MIVIGLSDIHGQTAAMDRLGKILQKADVVVLAGDITNFGNARHAGRVVESVRRYAGCVLGVPGNCDYPGVAAYLDQEGMNLHAKSRVIVDIGFAGLGGSLFTPFHTPNEHSETEIRRFLSGAAAGLPENLPFVLVSHQPPINTNCDRIRSGKHVGSRVLWEFIETRQPLVCITGHIHESVDTDRIGDTMIINPGRFGKGRYAFVEIRDEITFAEVRSIA